MSDITLLAIIFTIAMTLLILYVLRQKSHLKKKRQLCGITWLHYLRHLLAKVQQHRGLSSGYLNGDVNLMPRIDKLQTQIGDDIKKINSIDEWIIENQNWSEITEHWNRLRAQYTSNTVKNNLQQHGKLIRNLLYLVEEMAEEHYLLNVQSVSGVDIEFIWKDLLETTEYMGQARALGTGIAASGNCGSIEKVKLSYLKDKIQHGGMALSQQLPDADKAAKSIQLLLTTIDNNFIKPDKSIRSISAEDYFDISTKALSGIYEEYDQLIETVKAIVWNEKETDYRESHYTFQ